MGRRRSAALAVACWLIAGCTFTPFPAETSALACTDGRDNDGDGKNNCDDPDCWSFAHCRMGDDAGMGPPMMPPVIPEPPGPPLHPSPHDAGSTPTVPWEPDASAIDAAQDAAPDAEPPLLCGELCPPEHCVDGRCVTPPVTHLYTVESLTVELPTSRPDNTCFDGPAVCGFDGDLDPCCLPDPYVVVRVNDTKAGTLTSLNTASVVWDAVEVSFRVKLPEGAEVWFDVVDADKKAVGDPLDLDDQGMFTCGAIATADALAAGLLRCAPEGYDGLFERDYFVELAISPVALDPDAVDGEGEAEHGP